MKTGSLPALRNGQALDLDEVPLLSPGEWQATLAGALSAGARVCACFGRSAPEAASVELLAVLAQDPQGRLLLGRTRVRHSFPSLAAAHPQIQLFEREIAEQYGLRPEGHPWFKPVRFAPPLRRSRSPWAKAGGRAPRVGDADFYRVEGEEVHEVGVGPIHAGIIEPGHFRFQCHGEEVFHLEISLGYQHRGVERALIGGPDKRSLHLVETASGDASIAHATAYSQNLEALGRGQKPPRAQALRAVALELERLANHCGDLGALAGDVGFLPTASFCGRIRGDFLNLTALLCGNRFGRGLVRPGGAGFDVDEGRVGELLKGLDAAERDLAVAVELLWDTPSVMARFEGTGPLSAEQARELGLVGPAARACGLARDVRQDHPSGQYRFSHIPLSSLGSGDVFARAYVRWLEAQRSILFLREQCRSLPAGPFRKDLKALAPRQVAVSLVEGWRGEVCHVAVTDARGRLERYKVVDPSFHNWPGLALALRGQEISDFPLCNKSFNLSYCGHDL